MDETVARPPGVHTAPRALTPGTILGERYRIVSLLGSGGMGEVYRADDLKLGQTVALKFLSRRRDGAQERELYEEVRIGRQVSHPNVCRLYDIAEVDDQVFITMEFVDGEDLASLLRRVGRLPSDKAIGVARDVCAGLAAAHERGVIHRDLKPANVMIDGRGRARITDFGLAFGDRQPALHASAGTPAYMSPEQLSGEPASVQSDIYALGLVVYEVMTGRRAFEASTTSELLDKQRATSLMLPSQIVRDADPALERLMLACLSPDPAQRPQSVAEVMTQLPGGDAIAAAMAAGETPSPAMVAAAVKAGDLPLTRALLLCVFTLFSLVVIAGIAGEVMLHRQLPSLKSPDVLLERVQEVLNAARVRGRPADTSYLYFTNWWHVEAFEKAPPADFARQRTPIRFLYRSSPAAMVPRNAQHRVVTDDPPLVVPGMAEVTLDGAGRLMQMKVVPPQRAPLARQPQRADFTPLLALAGFDAAKAKEVMPQWAPPVGSDERRAWSVPAGPSSVRVEAAAFHGQPVWFGVIPPWSGGSGGAPEIAGRIAFIVTTFFLIALPIVVLLLARYNIRRGQGDRRGAWKIAVTMFALFFAQAVVRAHHAGTFVDEWLMLSFIVAASTFWAFMIWVAYIAVEPFARRWWPEMLISWTRLLQGRATDPMVGRDLLVGSAAGVAVIIVWQMAARGALNMVTTTLGELRHVAYYILRAVAEAVVRTIGALALLLLLRAVVKRRSLAIVIAGVLLAASFLNETRGPMTARMIYAVAAAAMVLFVLFRFGFLALVAAATMILLLRTIPLTLDTDAWYFGRSLMTLTVAAAIAIYGFVTSTRKSLRLPRLTFE